MKKVLLLVLSMVLAYGIVGCSKPTRLANCEVCGQRKQCYDVTWHMINEKTKKRNSYSLFKRLRKIFRSINDYGWSGKRVRKVNNK